MASIHSIQTISRYEPQRTNNFYLTTTLADDDGVFLDYNGNQVENADQNIKLALKGSGTPGYTIDVIEIRMGNAKSKYPGAPNYNDITLEFVDWIGKDIELLLATWHSLAFNPKTELVGLAENCKKTVYLVEYSPNEELLRTWIIEGAWLSSLDYGNYSMDSPGERQISGTLVYDRCYRQDDSEA